MLETRGQTKPADEAKLTDYGSTWPDTPTPEQSPLPKMMYPEKQSCPYHRNADMGLCS